MKVLPTLAEIQHRHRRKKQKISAKAAIFSFLVVVFLAAVTSPIISKEIQISRIKLTESDFQLNEGVEVNIGNYKPNKLTVILSHTVGEEVFETELEEGEYILEDGKIKIPPKYRAKTGKYKVTIIDEERVLYEQDFTWGVLAINFNKSIYLPNEKADISIAVLDETGMMVCDADVRLGVVNEELDIDEELSTEDGTIIVNPECFIHGFTLNPDYEAEYEFGDVGVYNFALTAVTANGEYTVKDRIEVVDSVPFDVERDSATRIFPPAEYPVTLTITAHKDFIGVIRETVPADFDVFPPVNNTPFDQIETIDDQKILSWEVDLKQGDSISIGYYFMTPNVSPEFYLLGPLRFVEIKNVVESSLDLEDTELEDESDLFIEYDDQKQGVSLIRSVFAEDTMPSIEEEVQEDEPIEESTQSPEIKDETEESSESVTELILESEAPESEEEPAQEVEAVTGQVLQKEFIVFDEARMWQLAIDAEASFTYTFDTTSQGWAGNGGSNITDTYRSDVGNPAGSLETKITGRNSRQDNTAGWTISGITWEDLGVPSGATVTHVDGNYDWRISEWDTGHTDSASGDLFITDNTDGNSTTLETGVTVSGTTSWATRNATGAIAIPSAIQAYNTSIKIKLLGTLRNANSASAVVARQMDNIALTITYDMPNQPPNTPTNTSPTNAAENQDINPTLQSSAFSDPDSGDTHANSQWQISTHSGGDFESNIVWDSGTTSSNLTSVVVNTTNGTFQGALNGETALAYSTTYYWRVRHQDNNTNWSSYSSTTYFTTEAPTNNPPNSPTTLAQKKTDETTLAVGDWTNETSVVFSAAVSDPDSDQVRLCVETKPLGTAFGDSENACGNLVNSGQTASVTISTQTDDTQYHWQARAKDANDAYSSWVSFGGNLESERDYGIDTSAPSVTGAEVFNGDEPGVNKPVSTASLSELSANWSGFDASVSGLNFYEYAIGTTAGGTDIKDWTNAGTDTLVTATGLTLNTTDTYYFTVRATDNAGNTSTAVNSGGQKVAPSLDFGIDSLIVTFDQLGTANDFTSTKTSTLTTSTNAYGGYVIRAYITALLTAADEVTTIINFNGGTYASPAEWLTSHRGFGYTSSDTLVQGSNKFNNNPCPGGGSPPCYASFSMESPGDIVADNTSVVEGTPIVDEVFTITYKVQVDIEQAALEYTTTVVYAVTALY
jgi:hypothetical protein